MPYETHGYHGLCCSCCYRVIHGDSYLSPAQTNPTAGTSVDAAAQLDMACDLDRALKAREDYAPGARLICDKCQDGHHDLCTGYAYADHLAAPCNCRRLGHPQQEADA